MATVLTPDLCVIGAGASGLAVARAARRLGASVVLVEKGETGGTSLKAGALALSALSAAAERAALAQRTEAFGVFAEPAKISFRKVHDHVAEIIRQTAPESDASVLAAQGIELVKGIGSFTGPKALKAGETEIRARRFVIATGARPVLPDIVGLHSVPYFTTETIFDNTRKLTHLMIIGAGPFGVELALAHRRLGCEVTIVESGQALPEADPELAEIALRRLREEGVTLFEQADVTAIQARSQGIGVTLRRGEEKLALDLSHILVAQKREPNLAELNLEVAKIRRIKGETGALALTASLRTSNPRIYAVGEAAGHATGAHLTKVEAELVVGAALLGRRIRYDPTALPRLIQTDPPIAEIGLTEAMARQLRINFSVLRAGYAETDLARAGRDGMGVVKLVVGRSGQILGAGICGTGASELVALLALAMEQRLPVSALAKLSAPYPSHAELLRRLGEQVAATMSSSRAETRLFALNRLLR